MDPIVSVVLPTYNRAKTLRRAIDSVLNQTFNDLELIIVDDGSTDETDTLFAEYSGNNQVRLISQLQRGCSVARNIGILASRGRYIAFQDSDDEWVSNKLEKAVVALENSGPEVGVFYSDMLRVEANGSSNYFHSPDVHRGILINEDTLDYQVWCIGIQSAVIKRECFEKAGLFDESLPRFIDLDLFIRLSDHFEFFHHQEALVKYFAGDGISTNHHWLVFAREYLLEKYRKRLEQNKHYLVAQYLHLQRAHDLMQIGALEAQLSDKQEQLENITNTVGWRLLRRYGPLKYRYLLPIYRLLGAAPTKGIRAKPPTQKNLPR